MAENVQYGRNLSVLLKDGMVLTILVSKIRDLRVPVEQSLMIHNLLETSPLKTLKDRKKMIAENLQRLKSDISPRVDDINSNISTLNKMISGLDFEHRIPKLNTRDITKVVSQRMNALLEIDNTQKIGNELFRKKLFDIFQDPTQSIFDFLKLVDKEAFDDKLSGLGEKYREGVRQALHVCSIGYYTTSVFIAGRTVEELINDYYFLLFQTGKLQKLNLSSLSFENKINKLFSERLLDESTYHSLSNIRIDRNKFGHPSSKQLNKESAHLKILVIISEIPVIEKRVAKLRKALGRR